MTVQQLIELSILDAMGLLDEDERLQFESAFRKATPGLQAHVRREQTRLSRIESLLPQVEPPAGLRATILEVIRGHMAAEIADDGLSSLAIPMARSRNVSSFWRAGAIGMAAASVMLGFTTFMFQSELQSLSQQLQQGSIVDELAREYGQKFVQDMIFNRDTERVVLTATAQDYKGQASLFINPEWDKAKFFCRAMSSPQGRNFKLAILDDSGKVVQVLQEFTSDGGLMPIDIDLDPGLRGQVAVMVSGDKPGQDHVLVQGTISGKSQI